MKRLGYALSAAALCSLALGPGFAMAAEGAAQPSSKEETVYVYANPDGSVKEEKVTAVLKNAEGASSLADSTMLSDIEAEDDDQDFTQDGTDVTWTANGSDVTYSGKTDVPAPISVSVTYLLDGKKASAEEIAGKSGKVAIRYDYRNDSPVSALGDTLYTPFTAVTALMFDADAFKNVSVKNGKVVNDGDDVVVIGYATPGLKASLGSAAEDADIPEYFEVEGDATDFELKSSLTMASAGLFEDMDLDEVDADELSDASSGLAEATSALVDGTDELASGLGTLADGTDGLSDAAWELNTGAHAAQDSIPRLVAGIEKLDAGAADLSKATAKLDAGMASLQQSVAQAQDVCKSAEAVLGSIGASLETVKSNNQNAEAIVQAAAESEEVPEATRSELAGALAALQQNDAYLAGVSAPAGTEAALQQLAAALQQLGAGLDPESAGALAAGASAVNEGAAALSEGLDALSDGTAPLVSGMRQLVYGTGRLAEGADQLAEGAKAAAEGSGALAQGMRTYSDEAISEIIDAIDNKVVNLLDRIDELKKAASDYDSFSGKIPGTPSSVRFVIEVEGA